MTRTHTQFQEMATTATAAAAKTRKRGVAAELLAREQQPKSKAKKEGVSSHVAAGQERPARLLYFTGMLHPFGAEEQCVRVSRGVHQVAEVFVPASMYAGTNPMYFLPHHGPSDVRDMFRRIFNVFGYLACSASQSTKQPKASDGSGVREVEYVPSPYTMHVTWEVVRSAKKRSLVVGYRLRLLEATIEAGSPGMAHRLAYDLIARNNDTAFKTMARLPGGRAPPSSSRFSAPAEPCSPFSVTTQAWNDLCRYYGGTSFAKETREQTSTQTGDKDSPFYLTNIFSLERSRELARNAGADPAYCSHAAYEGSGHDLCPYLYTWPHTEDVYGLLPSHLDPTSLSERTSPTRRPNMKQYTEARREYERLHGPGSGTLFDQLGVQTSDSTAAVDIHSLTLEAKRARKESELAAPGKPALQHALWRERQLELNRVMSDVLHPAGDCAPALQHIAAWGIGYLEENAHSFQCERTQSSSNLTAFGDFWAQQLDLLNTVANVISSHRMVVRMLLSAFGVFRRKNDNVHGLELGPPEAGKSFAMNTMTKMLIEKSWVNVADMTNRAMTGPGKANDSLVCVHSRHRASRLSALHAHRHSCSPAT